MMNILVIYDDTQKTLDCFDNFNPDFDFELLECSFATTEQSALELIRKNNFEHIIIAGHTIDSQDLSVNNFVPYNFLSVLKDNALSNASLHLVSPDEDFLRKGAFIAEALELDIKKYRIQSI